MSTAFASGYAGIGGAANMSHGMSVRAQQWPSSWLYSSRLTGLLGKLNFASKSSSHMLQSQMLMMTWAAKVVGVGIAEGLERCSHGWL